MALSYNERKATSPTDDTYAWTFPVLTTADIKCRHNGDELTAGDSVNGFTVSGGDAILGSAVTIATNDVVRVWRDTPSGALVDFQPGVLKESDLDTSTLQGLYRAHEAYDRAVDVLPIAGLSGAVLRKASGTDFDLTWDDALNASVAQLISANGVGAWTAADTLNWNTERVNQDNIVELDADTPASGNGNCVKMKTAGDFEFQVDAAANHTAGADAELTMTFYVRKVGDAWASKASVYLPQSSVAGTTSCQVSGTYIVENLEIGDKVAMLLTPSDAATNWAWLDKASSCVVRRIG